MSNQIKDYIQTQGLSLNIDDIAIARATAQAVYSNAQAHIEPTVLHYPDLPENFIHQMNILKQIFLVLDSTHTRHPVQTATIYALPESLNLIRIAQIGAPIENTLPINEDSTWQYLAARTAQSGWANISDDVAKWLQIGELHGEHNRRAVCQTSLPICGEDGAVFGVLHLEHAFRLPENELADWVGVVLGVLPALRELCPKNTENNDENQ